MSLKCESKLRYFIQENAFEKSICMISIILFRLQCVNHDAGSPFRCTDKNNFEKGVETSVSGGNGSVKVHIVCMGKDRGKI